MSPDEIEKTAAAWLGREDRGLSVEESDALETWLAQSNRVSLAAPQGRLDAGRTAGGSKSAAPVVHAQKGLRPRLLLALSRPASR